MAGAKEVELHLCFLCHGYVCYGFVMARYVPDMSVTVACG